MPSLNLKNLKKGDKFYLRKNVTLEDLRSIAFSENEAKLFLNQRKAKKAFIVHGYGIKDKKIYFDHEGYYAYFLTSMCETIPTAKNQESNHFFTKMFLLDKPNKKVKN